MTIVMWAALGGLLLAVLALGWLVLQVLRQQGRLLLRIEALEGRGPVDMPGAGDTRGGLPLATPFPPFRLASLEGGEVGLEDFQGKRVFLVHWSPECGFCRRIADDLARLSGDLSRRKTELLFVSYGSPEANRALMEQHGLRSQVLLQPDGQTVTGFARIGTPAAYLLDEKGRIAKPIAIGAHEVPELAEVAAGRRRRLTSELSLSDSRIEREGLKAGSLAPDFELPDLYGRGVSLAEQRGRRVLLVFSDPECGPCDALLPDLVRLDREHGQDDLMLMLVSRGGVEENRSKAQAIGVEFPVVLQSGWKLSKKYGIFATPVAFLIDEEGVIERDVARGPAEILALADSALSAEGRVPIS
jgi:peroxiredoxin